MPTGTTGNDSFTGTAANENFFLQQGGNDSASGAAGDDLFFFGAAFTAADSVDGGDGYDFLSLDGNYSAGLVFADTTLTNVEEIDLDSLGGGFSYNLTTAHATVADNQQLVVNAANLTGSGQTLTFDGSAQTADVLGAGQFTFLFGSAFKASDRIQGGSYAHDTIVLDGDYSAGLTLAASTITSIEGLTLRPGHSYDLTTNDGNVAASVILQVNGSGLDAGDHFTFDGSAETDGGFLFLGGAGDAVLLGGAQTDYFSLTLGGADTVSGGGGNDKFVFDDAFTHADHVNGGDGYDTLDLDGNYTSGLVFDPATLVNVEEIDLDSGFGGYSYNLTTDDATVSGNQVLVVNAANLYGGSQTLTFDGSAETTGSYHFLFGDALNALDRITGSGRDWLVVDGDYSGGMTFGASTMRGVELLALTAGHGYRFTTDDANVAAGKYLEVGWIGSAVGSDPVVFDGSHETDGTFDILGGSGSDNLTGGLQNDGFDLIYGGNDTARGGDGDDRFTLGSTLTAADRIDGGAGTDSVALDGDYTLSLGDATIKGIELITLATGHDYDLTMNDGNVDAGQELEIDGRFLDPNDRLEFNGVHESDGSYLVIGGTGSDHLVGGQQADRFDLSSGGADSVGGGDGDDLFLFSGALTRDDRIDGGNGYDNIILDGDYSAGLRLPGHGIQKVEALTVLGGHSYKLKEADGNVAAGASLFVDGKTLGGTDTLNFDGSHERDGTFVLFGGGGADTLTGGTGNDVITGGSGADRLTGNGGKDHFIYNGVGDSTGSGHDTIVGFDGQLDAFDLGLAVSGIDTSISGGRLRAGHFDADLQAAVGGGQLAAGHAVLLTPAGGSFTGDTFLVVDVNGAAGYQAAQDLVFELSGAVNMGAFGTHNFI